MVGPLILIVNASGASRRYAVFDDSKCLAELHFELRGKQIHCTLISATRRENFLVKLPNLQSVLGTIIPLLEQHHVISPGTIFDAIGMRIVAPSSYFLQDRIVNSAVTEHLKTIVERSPLHSKNALKEIELLRLAFPRIKIVAVSDSAFHAHKPDHAWNYGINLNDADRLDIKRFGYQGLAAAAVVHRLKVGRRLPQKLLICHIGSGVSVTAVLDGKSIDNSMGFTPLDGPIMGTSSGSIDPSAVISLKAQHGLKDKSAERYLNQDSGLYGLSGKSADLRDLLRDQHHDHRVKLAIDTYVYSIQKSIGQMAAALNGADALVFSGTVGVRSPEIRQRVLQNFSHLGFYVNQHLNNLYTEENDKLAPIHVPRKSKPVYVITADESGEIAKRTRKLLN